MYKQNKKYMLSIVANLRHSSSRQVAEKLIRIFNIWKKATYFCNTISHAAPNTKKNNVCGFI